MRRVLLLSNLYPSAHESTRGTFNLQGFRALGEWCETRIVVPVLWWERTRRPMEWLAAPRSSATGIEAVYPSCWHVPQVHALHPWTMYASVRPYVHRVRREFKFDAILASWACPDGVAAARLAAECGCPVITMVLGTDVNALSAAPALRRHLSWGLKQAQQVITVSGALRERVAALGVAPHRIRVQHNGVDGERFRIRSSVEARAEFGLDPQRRLICFAGNLVQEKGVDVLLAAFRQVVQADDRTDLVLIGKGPLDAALRRHADEAGIGVRVHFAGRRPHEELPLWMAAADVFCLPSRREGCPNVILEALACGRPVVASRVGGIPELITDANGVLVPAEDANALAAGLRTALARRWGPAELRRTVPYLSWRDFGRSLYDAIEDGISEYRSPAALSPAA